MFRNIELFFRRILPNLSDEAWQAFQERLTVHSYKKGELISEEEKVCQVISFIEKGAVIAFNHVDGKKHIYNFFFEHEYTSDYESFLTRLPAKYGLEAIEDTLLLNMHYTDLHKMYEQHPIFERAGRLAAEAQFIRVVRQTSSLLSEKPEARYLNLLHEKPQVFQRVPQYYIASYLGVTPEALSRIRKRISSAR